MFIPNSKRKKLNTTKHYNIEQVAAGSPGHPGPPAPGPLAMIPGSVRRRGTERAGVGRSRDVNESGKQARPLGEPERGRQNSTRPQPRPLPEVAP